MAALPLVPRNGAAALADSLQAAQPDIRTILVQLHSSVFTPAEARRLLALSRRPDGGLEWLRVLAEEAKVFPLNREGHVLLLQEMLAAAREDLNNALSFPTGHGHPLLRVFARGGSGASPSRQRVAPKDAEAMLKIFAWYIALFEQKYGAVALFEALAPAPELRDSLLAVLRVYRPPFKITECPVCLETVAPGEDVGLACLHAIHIECARGLTKLKCPYCRSPFAGARLRLKQAEIEAIRYRERRVAEERENELTRQFFESVSAAEERGNELTRQFFESVRAAKERDNELTRQFFQLDSAENWAAVADNAPILSPIDYDLVGSISDWALNRPTADIFTFANALVLAFPRLSPTKLLAIYYRARRLI